MRLMRSAAGRRSWLLGSLAALAGVGAISGCAATSEPASFIAATSPANMVPSGAPLYFAVDLHYGSPNLDALERIINKFGGKNTTGRLVKRLELRMSKHGAPYSQSLRGWFDGRFGVALTGWPSKLGSGKGAYADLLLVIPTDDPGLARKDLPVLLHQAPKHTVGKLDGHYLLLGSAKAVAAAGAAYGSSLSDNSSFKKQLVKLPSDPALTFYVNLSSVAAEIKKQLGTSSPYSNLSSQLKPGAAEMVTLNAAPHAVQINSTYVNVVKKSGAPSPGVTGLPAGSWLALATPGLTTAQLREFATALSAGQVASATGTATTVVVQHSIRPAQQAHATTKKLRAVRSYRAYSYSPESARRARKLEQQARREIEQRVDKSITSGIGPISFSLAGDSLTTLSAGLDVAPSGTNTGQVMLADVYSFLKSQASSAQITGDPQAGAFTIKVGGFVVIHVSVANGHLVATYGYPSASSYTTYSPTLASNAAFRSALKMLPAGAKPDFYLNFGGLKFLSQLAALSGGGGAQTQQLFSVLDKLNYVIAGRRGTVSRIVIGIH